MIKADILKVKVKINTIRSRMHHCGYIYANALSMYNPFVCFYSQFIQSLIRCIEGDRVRILDIFLQRYGKIAFTYKVSSQSHVHVQEH